MTKKPLADNEVAAAAVPCCKNEENSPTNAGGGTDGFIGSSSDPDRAGNPLATPNFSSYPPRTDFSSYIPRTDSSSYPPMTYPAAATIYCAGNYGPFMPGCISYLSPVATPLDVASNQEQHGDVFYEDLQRLTDVYNQLDHPQRLTDVYNQLDHPQSTASSAEKSGKEKIFLDLVFDENQN